MSKLDELIQELCPDGVPFVKLEELCQVMRGKRLTKSQLSDDGQYVVYHGSKGTPLGFYDDYNVEGDTVIVVNTGGIGGVKYIKDNFWCSDGSFWIKHNDKINNKFLYYYLVQYEGYYLSQKRVGGVPTIDKSVVSNTLILLPPLEVQCEIVRILDKFTLLTAELTARRKQYEYYRNYLLKIFGEVKELGEISEFSTGEKPKEILIEKKSDLYQYINAGTTNSGYSNLSNRRKGAVTTPSRGQGGIGFVGYQENEFWLGPLCYAIYSKDETILNPKYLYYELYSKKDEILKRKNTGGVPSLNARDLKTILINIPSIEKQNKIVDILDKFDTLCNDITSGIPAEIELNNKRYEYYRDKLLTFKEKNNG